MKKFKTMFATILMTCIVMSLCACGNTGAGDSEQNSNNSGSELESTADSGSENAGVSEDDGKVVYTIKVVDANGNPVASTLVQLCDDGACYAPVMTDANGVAEFRMVEGEYKAAISGIEEYYYFEGDSKEVTITVAAQ